METGMLNLGSLHVPSHKNETESAPGPDASPLEQLIEETRSDIRRTRSELERQQDEQARRTNILSYVLGVLAVIVIIEVVLWIHEHPVKKAMIFDNGEPGKTFQLMFTEIRKNDVAGYLPPSNPRRKLRSQDR